ncbi:MAG: hypothetical protein K2X81_06285, partial [Candidatus Obscuribacterales bacterium]|nr:hypothetical protein [Candidatus Obscuribacterales bacterium]
MFLTFGSVLVMLFPSLPMISLELGRRVTNALITGYFWIPLPLAVLAYLQGHNRAAAFWGLLSIPATLVSFVFAFWTWNMDADYKSLEFDLILRKTLFDSAG